MRENKTTYDEWFDTETNKALTAICTRKLIRNIGIGGILWGVLNIGLGVAFLLIDPINIGIVLLGGMMLFVGTQALRAPSLNTLRMETIAALLLFVWNVSMAIYNQIHGGIFEIRGIIFPLIIAGTMSKHYVKLKHLETHIETIEQDKVKTTHQMCKTLIKKKLKHHPSLIETTNKRCRAQLMKDEACFVQRDLLRAFVSTKQQLKKTIVNQNAKRLSLHINHPVSKLKYQFNKKNSEKIRIWLSDQNSSEFETA